MIRLPTEIVRRPAAAYSVPPFFVSFALNRLPLSPLPSSVIVLHFTSSVGFVQRAIYILVCYIGKQKLSTSKCARTGTLLPDARNASQCIESTGRARRTRKEGANVQVESRSAPSSSNDVVALESCHFSRRRLAYIDRLAFCAVVFWCCSGLAA